MENSKSFVSKKKIVETIISQFPGLVVNENWGETGLFYNPHGKLKKGIYLLTFKDKDGKNDKSSNLDREDTYRLNLGISKETFIKLFKRLPKRPPAGNIVDMEYDFTAIDTIMPHPIYSWMAWVCVINPSAETLKKLMPLIEEGYNLAISKYKKKKL
jgi:hypothetical protein